MSTQIVEIWWLDPLCLPINCAKVIKVKKVDFKLFWAHLYSKNSQKITHKWVKLPYKALELSWTLFPANFSYTPKKYG